jgi:hypothetical protein
MSDWPELERRLNDSARRRYGRQRWTLRRFAPVPLLVAAAVAAFFVLSSGPASTVPNDERAVPTQAPRVDPVDRYYGVFRRPPTATDAAPMTAEQRRRMSHTCASKQMSGLCWRLETARLVYREGGTRFYLVRGKGANDLCLANYVGRRVGGVACSNAGASQLARPMGGYGAPIRGRQGVVVYTVFPDAVKRVAYLLADGGIVVRGVKDNFAVLHANAPVTSMSWTVDGRRYVQPVIDPSPDAVASGQSCPALDPPPAQHDGDAEGTARATALGLGDLKPDQILATSIRPATVADIDSIRRQACGDLPAERSRVVELRLRQGPSIALLVGFHAGKAFVWSQLR